MSRHAILALVLSLAACAPSEPGEPEPDLERQPRPIIMGRPGPNGIPEWRAVIVPGRLLLDSPTSAGWYSLPLPEPRQETAPRRLTFSTAQVTLVGEIDACPIPGYREALPNRFTLHWDGGRFEGCNGRGRLPTAVGDTIWELVRLGGQDAPDGRSPAATLIWGARGSLGGTLACNDGGIRTTWIANGGFAPGPPGFEQTAMGCNDPAGEAFGMRFWRGMMTATAWRRDGARLFITFADGTEAELRYLL